MDRKLFKVTNVYNKKKKPLKKFVPPSVEARVLVVYSATLFRRHFDHYTNIVLLGKAPRSLSFHAHVLRFTPFYNVNFDDDVFARTLPTKSIRFEELSTQRIECTLYNILCT